MIDPALYAAFIGATVALMLIPGPNWAVITANSVAHGTRYGLLTVAATSVAVAVQLGMVTMGMAVVLAAAGEALSWLRWAGVLYLVGLGVLELSGPSTDLTRIAAMPRARLVRRVVARAAAVALTNPKTLLFFAAFFPQFVSAHSPAGPQIALLAGTFVTLNILIDASWAVVAGRVRPLLLRRARLRRGMTGGLLIGAGAGLGIAGRT